MGLVRRRICIPRPRECLYIGVTISCRLGDPLFMSVALLESGQKCF